jgi:hypothetical protein
LSPPLSLTPRRYLKRIFRDLFERSGFEDDGLFDWDLALKPKADGTNGLEGLKYGTPRDGEGERAEGATEGAQPSSSAAAAVTSPSAPKVSVDPPPPPPPD